MKKIFQVALGIVTSIGGYLEVGSIATSAQAGAEFRYELSWSIVIGTLCLIFLVEMSGRLAAVSKKTIADAIRERFGFSFFLVPLIGVGLVTFLMLASELGGVALSLQLATGIRFVWWALPVTFVTWILLWRGTFSMIENGVAFLGLVTVCFAVGAFRMHPSWHHVAAGMLPTVPSHDLARYGFIGVSILGATISPYLFLFYSSGALEDRWGIDDLMVNRATAVVGMGFGGSLSVAVLIVAGAVFFPRGIHVDKYDQIALVLTPTLGRWGFILFVASLGIACLGAALEIALALGYLVAQGFGWEWGEDEDPRRAARFAMVYTLALLLGGLLILIGIDPLKLTVLTMALTALTLPLIIVPFLLLMNDKDYLKQHTNGWVSNIVVVVSIAIAFVVALVAIPLQLTGGG